MNHPEIHPRGSVYGLLLALFTLLAGCGLEKPYPDKTLHSISVSAPPQAASSQGTKVLRVNVAHIAKPFDGTTFFYKTGESTFISDYYNGFITTPDLILTGNLSAWLSQSGLFSAVIDGNSGADSQLSMETNVTSLFGDFSDKDAPAAVLAMKVFLVENNSGKYVIVFQKEYSETEPIPNSSPGELVKGWERAYHHMLTDLVTDLRTSGVTQ